MLDMSRDNETCLTCQQIITMGHVGHVDMSRDNDNDSRLPHDWSLGGQISSGCATGDRRPGEI